jgi:adenylosuccinate lyase
MLKRLNTFIKQKFDALNLQEYKEFIHFGLTSQDINNTAIPYTFKLALDEVYYPAINEVVDLLKKYAADWDQIPMLAHTHGQAASPTRLGKEIQVFVERLENQLYFIKASSYICEIRGCYR